MFLLRSVYNTSNISIEEEHQVFFWSVVNFPDNYRRYCGDSHLRYYDFSSFLLLETPGFSKLLWAPPPGPSAPGPYNAPPDPQLARAMTFACLAHFMTSSLPKQTFSDGSWGGGGGGGDHMKLS